MVNDIYVKKICYFSRIKFIILGIYVNVFKIHNFFNVTFRYKKILEMVKGIDVSSRIKFIILGIILSILTKYFYL